MKACDTLSIASGCCYSKSCYPSQLMGLPQLSKEGTVLNPILGKQRASPGEIKLCGYSPKATPWDSQEPTRAGPSSGIRRGLCSAAARAKNSLHALGKPACKRGPATKPPTALAMLSRLLSCSGPWWTGAALLGPEIRPSPRTASPRRASPRPGRASRSERCQRHRQ